MMKISIVTATWNSDKTVERNIKSVLGQDYCDVEHIFIDNLSGDKTLEIIEKSHDGSASDFKVYSGADKGIADAFNKGIGASSGEIIGLLNSDDFYPDPQVISRVMDAFSDPKVMFVHGNMFFEDPVHGSNLRKPLLCPPTYAFPYNHPAFFVRSDLYKKLGLFDISYKFAMDFELICRMYETPNQCAVKGVYLDGDALVCMSFGGVSQSSELASILEVKRALQLHNFYNFSARVNLLLRMLRIKVKSLLSAVGLNWLVVWWRNRKWA